VNFAEETVSVRYNPGKPDRKEVFISVRKLGHKIKNIGEK